MQIAHRILYPKHFCIVSTTDGFVGIGGFMGWLMRQIGCIPTQKYITDLGLVQDMTYALKTLKTSVLMYPEACYSFDGTATTLPRKMGVLLKKFDVPVIMIESFGAFSRNPLYNELQIRKSVPVSAKARCLYTQEQVRTLSVQELSDGLDNTDRGILQDSQGSGNGLGVGGHGNFLDGLVTIDIVVQTAVNADTLAQALSGHDAGLGIHQLILQGRGAGIDDQNVHWNLPPKNKYFLFSNFVV
jgi:hypothetical protein